MSERGFSVRVEWWAVLEEWYRDAASTDYGADGRDRTSDPLIKSQMLAFPSVVRQVSPPKGASSNVTA